MQLAVREDNPQGRLGRGRPAARSRTELARPRQRKQVGSQGGGRRRCRIRFPPTARVLPPV
eukprot:9711160-Lingulodinium_polyedra.AAC.1